VELYINTNWTDSYANTYIAEAIAWSENGAMLRFRERFFSAVRE